MYVCYDGKCGCFWKIMVGKHAEEDNKKMLNLKMLVSPGNRKQEYSL